MQRWEYHSSQKNPISDARKADSFGSSGLRLPDTIEFMQYLDCVPEILASSFFPTVGPLFLNLRVAANSTITSSLHGIYKEACIDNPWNTYLVWRRANQRFGDHR